MVYQRSSKKLRFLLILLSTVISACSFQDQQFSGKLIKQSGKASIHEVSHDSIRSYMHKLDTIVFEPYYSELERDQYRFRYTSKIVEVVNTLTQELEQDPGLKLGLDPAQQQDFLNLAQQLKTQAKHLNTSLSNQKSSELKSRIAQMIQVCNSCHQQYRSR